MSLGREQIVHGASWAQVHGGYFSDPEVARPLVEAVGNVWDEARPDGVVDLGGGTGFMLGQIRAAACVGIQIILRIIGEIKWQRLQQQQLSSSVKIQAPV